MTDESLLDCLPTWDADFRTGANCTLWDAEGRRFVDLESGSWAAVLGHCHPSVTRVLQEQAATLVHLNVRLPNAAAVAAARALRDKCGLHDGACVFLSSGSEAVEFGVRVLRCVSGRRPVLSLAKSYLSAFGSAGAKSASEWVLFDWQSARAGDVEAALDGIPFDRLAGFVLETGGGTPDFVRFPPTEIVAELARRVRAGGGLLMVNEVTTGLGRTGSWFSYQRYGLEPDVVAVGKGLGNGYPVSATVLARDVARRYESAGTRYAQSHQNNPLGCAVAVEVLREIETGRWIERGRAKGEQLRRRIATLPDPHGRLADVRGAGMLIGVEFRRGRGLDGETARRFLWERGFVAASYPEDHPAGTGLRFDPALTIEDADLDVLVTCLGDLLAS